MRTEYLVGTGAMDLMLGEVEIQNQMKTCSQNTSNVVGSRSSPKFLNGQAGKGSFPPQAGCYAWGDHMVIPSGQSLRDEDVE